MWNLFGISWGTLEHFVWGPRRHLNTNCFKERPLKIIGSILKRTQWGGLGDPRSTIRGDVLDQSWPPKTARKQQGRPRQREDDRG